MPASQGLGLHVGSRPRHVRERGGGMEQFFASQLLHDGLPLWGAGPTPEPLGLGGSRGWGWYGLVVCG